MINRDLSDQLKYVVLSHELAHYALHFPVIFGGQLIEQVAWTHPAAESHYQNAVRRLIPGSGSLEEQANVLASHLLVPAQLNLLKLAEIIHTSAATLTADHWAWIFLQPLFPETSTTQYSWHNWREMAVRSERDLRALAGINAMTATTLYEAMLSATINRETDASRKLSQDIGSAILALWHEVPQIIKTAADHGVELHEDLQPLQVVDQIDKARTILPPLVNSSGGALRLPLVPVGSSASGAWRNVIDLTAAPRNVGEWQAQYPAHSVILYDRPAPIGPVFHL